MEAIATGALIFVDNMHVHRPYPLMHDKHIVYYDNHNKTELFEKLDFYMTNIEAARTVAVNGYVHAMKFHRAASLMDYVFRSIHLKLRKIQLKAVQAKAGGAGVNGFRPVPAIHPPYTHTGFHIRNLCKEKPGEKGEGQ